MVRADKDRWTAGKLIHKTKSISIGEYHQKLRPKIRHALTHTYKKLDVLTNDNEEEI
uniref:Uncharacterized protein n=1 Tax=Arion vulgaris TaxID=1028688 RepID=A0A0B6Z878_9EUPU